MALANNPVYYAEVLDGQPARLGLVGSESGRRGLMRWGRSTVAMSEPEADRLLAVEGVGDLLRDRPTELPARASIARLGRFWGLAPSEAVYRAWLRAISDRLDLAAVARPAVGLATRSLAVVEGHGASRPIG